MYVCTHNKKKRIHFKFLEQDVLCVFFIDPLEEFMSLSVCQFVEWNIIDLIELIIIDSKQFSFLFFFQLNVQSKIHLGGEIKDSLWLC